MDAQKRTDRLVSLCCALLKTGHFSTDSNQAELPSVIALDHGKDWKAKHHSQRFEIPVVQSAEVILDEIEERAKAVAELEVEIREEEGHVK